MKYRSIRLLLGILCTCCLTITIHAQASFFYRGTPLITGIPGTVGAKYTWPNVGISDGITVKSTIEILNITGGAILAKIDGNDFGYDDAWQPVINGPNTADGSCWGIEFLVSFFDAATDLPLNLRTFSLTGVDIDGDKGYLHEYNSFERPGYFIVENPTLLTVTEEPGFINFKSAVEDRAGIDASSTDIAATIHYKLRNNFRVRLGACCIGGECDASGPYRLHCLYPGELVQFNKPDTVYMDNGAGVLPLTISSFSGSRMNDKTILRWHTDNETDMQRFYVEKSCDGSNFTSEGSIESKSNEGLSNDYAFQLSSSGLCDPALTYLRLKCVSKNGKANYSRTIRLSSPGNQPTGIFYANGYLHVQQPGQGSAAVTISILDMNNRMVYNNKLLLNGGENVVWIPGASSLPTGIYLVQLATPSVTTSSRIFMQR